MRFWLLFLLLFYQCKAPASTEGGGLTVGTRHYTKEEMAYIFQSYPLPFKQSYLTNSFSIDYTAFGEFMAKEILFADKAKEKGLDKRKELQAMGKWAVDRLLSQMYAREVIYPKLVSEEDIQHLYEEKRKNFTQPPMVHLRHLLITPKPNPILYNEEGDDAKNEEEAGEKIKKVQALLAQGKSLEVLAKKYSEDASAPKGGDIGWVPLRELDQKVVEVIQKMKKGEMKGPIQTPFGYHFIELLDYQEERAIPLSLIRSDLLREALSKKGDVVKKILDDAFKERMEKGEIQLP